MSRVGKDKQVGWKLLIYDYEAGNFDPSDLPQHLNCCCDAKPTPPPPGSASALQQGKATFCPIIIFLFLGICVSYLSPPSSSASSSGDPRLSRSSSSASAHHLRSHTQIKPFLRESNLHGDIHHLIKNGTRYNPVVTLIFFIYVFLNWLTEVKSSGSFFFFSFSF